MTVPGNYAYAAGDHGTEARTAMERSALYGFLVTVFRSEPTEPQIKEMKSPSFQEALGGLDLGFLEPDETELARDLAVEYAALFLGPGGHVSPHESVHVEDGGQLLGEATAAVKTYIEACGFEYDPDYHGLPDHISTELEFMAEVTRQEAVAWQECDFTKVSNCLEYEGEFLDRHLGRWAPSFCEKVTQRAELPFYRRIVEVTQNFLEAEVGEIDRRRSLAQSMQDGSGQVYAGRGHH